MPNKAKHINRPKYKGLYNQSLHVNRELRKEINKLLLPNPIVDTFNAATATKTATKTEISSYTILAHLNIKCADIISQILKEN